MSCRTCDHTMQLIQGGIFWCPRCGTLKLKDRDGVPSLVGRTRRMLTGLTEVVDEAEGEKMMVDVAESVGWSPWRRMR